MNYIRHLTGFFERVCKDHRLNPTHISVYMAIFQFWNVNRFRNPLSISRSEIMELSKVSSRNTYHKCMKELHQFGYFRYDPSYHPLRGSWVYLFAFKNTEEGDQYKNETGSGLVVDSLYAGDVQAEVGLLPETLAGSGSQEPLNISKHIKLNKLISIAEKRESVESTEEGRKAGEKKKRLVPPEKNEGSEVLEGVPGSLDDVTEFFVGSGYPKAESLKFFHFYRSTGWKYGGKTPIQNWQSAAHSWMLHAQNSHTNPNTHQNGTENPHSKQLHARTDKNYSEPL